MDISPATITIPQDPTAELVSVILPIGECHAGVERSIRSVAAQTHPNIELVLVDSSGEEQIEALDQVNGITYRYVPPDGVAVARNQGIAVATGEFTAFLDADDRFKPPKVERQVAMMDSADVVYTDATVHFPDGDTEHRKSMPIEDSGSHDVKFYKEDGRAGNIPTSSILVRSSLLETHTFHEELVVKEDYHLWVRLFRDGCPTHIQDPLTELWIRENSLSSDPEQMYRYGVQAAQLLADQDSRYQPYCRDRITLERYDYGRHLLLETGDAQEAQRVFFKSLTQDRYFRAFVLLAISLLPFDPTAIIRSLDQLRGTITQVR